MGEGALAGAVGAGDVAVAAVKSALAGTDRFLYSLGGINAANRAFASVHKAEFQLSDFQATNGTFDHTFTLGQPFMVRSLSWAAQGAGVPLRVRADRVSSEPLGARIAIDGQDTGKTTPARLPLGGLEQRHVVSRLPRIELVTVLSQRGEPFPRLHLQTAPPLAAERRDDGGAGGLMRHKY